MLRATPPEDPPPPEHLPPPEDPSLLKEKVWDSLKEGDNITFDYYGKEISGTVVEMGTEKVKVRVTSKRDNGRIIIYLKTLISNLVNLDPPPPIPEAAEIATPTPSRNPPPAAVIATPTPAPPA